MIELNEGRGFTYKGALYAAGGSKDAKKYYKNGKEITKATYNRALMNYRLEKAKGTTSMKDPEETPKTPKTRKPRTTKEKPKGRGRTPLTAKPETPPVEDPKPTEDTPKKRGRKPKETPTETPKEDTPKKRGRKKASETPTETPPVETKEKTPLIAKKKKKFVPTVSLGKRLDALQERLHENIFVPSEKEGEEGKKENLERINKMLPMMKLGINISGVVPKGVEIMCNTISKMATDWPIMFDDDFPLLNFIGTPDAFFKRIDDYIEKELPDTEYAKLTQTITEARNWEINNIEKEIREFDKGEPSDPKKATIYWSNRRWINNSMNCLLGNIHRRFKKADFLATTPKDVFAIMSSHHPYAEVYQTPKNIKTFLNLLDEELKKGGINVDFSNDQKINDFLNTKPKPDYSHIVFSQLLFRHILSKDGNKDKLLEFMHPIDIKKLFYDAYAYKMPNTRSNTMRYETNVGGVFSPCYTTPFHGVVNMNPKYSGSEKSKIDLARFGYGNGKGVFGGVAHASKMENADQRNGLNHLVIHEMAHALTHRLTFVKSVNTSSKDGMLLLSDLVGDKFNPDPPIIVKGKSYNNVKPSELFEKIWKDNKNLLNLEISDYATTSYDEMIAEAFSQFYCSTQPSQFAIDIVNVFKYLMKLNAEVDMKERGATE